MTDMDAAERARRAFSRPHVTAAWGSEHLVAKEIRQAEQAARERCAKACDRRAENAEKRAATHTNKASQAAALDKMEAHMEDAEAIRALSEES